MGITVRATPENWGKDGVWYAPDFGTNQKPVRVLNHLRAKQAEADLSKQERKFLEQAERDAEAAGWCKLRPYTAGQYQAARARSPHLGINVQVKGRTGTVKVEDQAAQEAAFMCEVIRERVIECKGIGFEGEDGEPVVVTTGAELVEAVQAGDETYWELLSDIYEAIKTLSHLERGVKKA